MKYRLTISDEKKTTRVALITIISFIAFEFLAFFVLSYGFDKRRVFDFVFLSTMPLYLLALYLGVYKQLFREEIEIKNGFIATQHFGKISLNEIDKYNYKVIRGTFKLTLFLKEGKKLHLTPPNRRRRLKNSFLFLKSLRKKLKTEHAKS